MAHVTLYCQFNQVTPEALILLVNKLVNIRLLGWISHYDDDIDIIQSKFSKDTLQFEYQFKKENEKRYSISQPVDISAASTIQRRFQSGSWNQESIVYQQQSYRNISSSHLASSYGQEGYNEEEGMIAPEKEMRIQVMDHPNITITLPEHPDQSNRFAQMCLNCYYRKDKGYTIQLIHPIQFMQYFIKNNSSEMTCFRIHLTIKKSNNRVCCVNNNNWPVRPSLLLSSEYEQEGKESSAEEEDDDGDIFVDGMESFNIQTRTVNEAPILRSSHSTPVPSTVTLSEPLKNKSEDAAGHSDESKHEVTIPDSDPLAIRQIYPRFIEYLEATPQSILQRPTIENGGVSISKIDVPSHPLGGLVTNTVWNNCSIWDVKAVLECPGAQKIWDPLFDGAQLVYSFSSSSSIWHTKRKATWLLRVFDSVCFHSEYKSDNCITICSTSCPSNDTYQHKDLPKPTSSHARATVDLNGIRLKRIDTHSVSFESVLLIQLPSSWLSLPPTISSFASHCSVIQYAKAYFDDYGAPPSIEDMTCALLLDTTYDHDGKSWRCEYTRHDTQNTSTNEVKATRMHIRLDKRRWAKENNNQYSVVIDPPPSRYTAIEKSCDRFGIWLTIEHDEAFIIPLCGKILVLIKPNDAFTENIDKPISINGVYIAVEPPVEVMERKPSYSENFLLDDLVEKKTVTPNKTSVMDHASTVFSFLKQTDEQFGWTVMSDNAKTGTRICKKSGSKNSSNSGGAGSNSIKEEESEKAVLNVPEPFMIYKATKVIENFSLDEVISVVTDIDQIRRAHDDTIDSIQLHRQVEPGCRIVRQSVKAIFPFKSRDLYTCTCLAQESSSLAMQPTKRTFYIESSLPDYHPESEDVKKPVGNLFISGWILEPVDPYTTSTNHPIPSTRVCYVAALDLGQSVPSYISNHVANNWLPKKIQAVEGFLKSKEPPPYLVQPSSSPLVFTNNTLTSETQDGFELKETQSTYDRKEHVYRVVNQWLVSEPSTKKANTKPDESAIPFIAHRRPSHGTAFAETMYRRGSLPSGILKKRIGPLGEKVTTTSSKDVTCLECRIDLRSYPKGYEMTCHLWDMSEFKRDMTGKLTVLVTEPPLSNLMNSSDGKKHNKHTILITADITLSDATLELEFELVPAGDESIQRRGTRLTVSGVLGEEDNKDWDGIMLMNGKELSLGKETVLDYVQEYDIDREDEARPSIGYPILESKTVVEEPISLDNQTQDEKEDGEEENKDAEEKVGGIQYIGGGVVATAIGNVSAGVNVGLAYCKT
ncbi:hypothetical protein K501DRAFT_195436 [Backusella circina FSU 941]|nr:hypothetical protein K501DRAFT_195436 [Backusella circina FSU 941]